MAKPMFLRQGLWHFRITLAKLLVGSKATSPHFAFIGAASSGHLCRRIAESGHRDVLVVTDGPLRELGIADKAVSPLSLQGVRLHWYDGVKPDPTFTHVREGAAALKSANATAVLAVGGGSSIDAAKMIALMAEADSEPETWVGFQKAPESAAPIYAIPTTAGTGSEATMGAVITDENDHSKNVISGSAMLPRAVALDPDLMLGLPPMITAATGMDALTHGVEAYIGRWERGTRTETASMCIRGVFEWLPRALAEPQDAEARLGMAVAAYYGGVAINQVNVGSIHAIAHQLGSLYHLPHGVANNMVMPHLLRVYGVCAEPKLAELAALAGIDDTQSNLAARVIDAIELLGVNANLPTTCDAITKSDYPRLISRAVEESDGYVSPRLLTEADVASVLDRISG
jgi:alcohol dehydrogenase class IV